MPNESERRRWNNEEWVAHWPRRELFTNAVVGPVLKALDPQPGEQILDIGPGGGNLSFPVAARVAPGGKVTGADISVGLTGLARERAHVMRRENVTFEVCDLQVDPPPGGPFDAATSQFGVMFFEDPVAAFANIRKSLKPGGRLVFACWQPGIRNTWCVVPVLVPFMANPPGPPSAGPPPPGPFAFGEPAYVRGILHGSGFRDISRKARTIITRIPYDAVADDSVVRTWGVPPERHDAALEAVAQNMEQFAQPDGLYRVPLKVQIFTARNP